MISLKIFRYRLPRFLRSLVVSSLAVIAFHPILPCLQGETTVEAKGELFHNEDSTNFFYYKKFSGEDAAATINRFVDVMWEAGVTTYLCNTNARRTNYHSNAWNSFWEGYDPDGPDDQPFLKSVKAESVEKYRQLIGNMMTLDDLGIDFPAAVIQRCREREISPWVSLRMNDCHLNTQLDHPFHGEFWKENPQFSRKHATGYFANCLDFSHPEVREYFMALVDETLERFDVDGLELDFMREPYLFSTGKEAEGAIVLTQWIAEVREKLDAAALKRGHTIQLGVRVPSHPDAADRLGLRAVDWAKAGSIDVLVATPRWATVEFDMPIEKWRERLAGTSTKLLGGLEVRYLPGNTAAASMVTPEMATAAAASVLSRGADAVYLFNYFQDGHPGWKPSVFRETLRSMKSLDSLLRKERRTGVTFRDIVGPGEKYLPPLPKSGNEIRIPVYLYSLGNEADISTCEVLIGMPSNEEMSPAAPTVEVNGKTCKLLSDTTPDSVAKNRQRTLLYQVPFEALKPSGQQEVAVLAGATTSVTINRLEIALLK